MLDQTNNTLEKLRYDLLQISGLDAEKFLQGLVSCDVENLSIHQLQFGMLCNVQGRVVFSFYLFKETNQFNLIIFQPMVTKAVNLLKKYAKFSKINFNLIPDVIYGANHLIDNHIFEFNLQLNDQQYLLLNPSNQMINLTKDSPFRWHYQNIKKEMPEIYPATSEKFLPQELNYYQKNAISYSKGCFLGQEIIARIHYKGKIKKKLINVSIKHDQDIIPGMEISNDQKNINGYLVDFCQIDYNEYETLILIDQS